jgi:hypothetical protein
MYATVRRYEGGLRSERSSAIRVAPLPLQPDGRGTIRFVTFTERPQLLTLVFDGA